MGESSSFLECRNPTGWVGPDVRCTHSLVLPTSKLPIRQSFSVRLFAGMGIEKPWRNYCRSTTIYSRLSTPNLQLCAEGELLGARNRELALFLTRGKFEPFSRGISALSKLWVALHALPAHMAWIESSRKQGCTFSRTTTAHSSKRDRKSKM